MDSDSWTLWVLVLGIAILVLMILDGSPKRSRSSDKYFTSPLISSDSAPKPPPQPIKPIPRPVMQRQVALPKPSVRPAPRVGPDFILVPVPNDARFGSMFWTFKVTGSPSANWSTPLRGVLSATLPIAPGSTEAACVLQPTGIVTKGVPRGMKPAHVFFIHPNGYKVPVDAKLGTDGIASMNLTIDMKQGVLPAALYREGTFVLFKGKDCSF